MPATITTFDAVLKEFYEGPVRNVINNSVLLLRLANAAAETVGGRRVMFPVQLGRNVGVGGRAEGGTLPVSGNQRYVTCTVPRRRMMARIDLTGDVIKSSQGNRAAFANAMADEMTGVANDVRKYANRVLFVGERDIVSEFPSGGATISTTTITFTSGRPVGNPQRFVEIGTIYDGVDGSSAVTLTTTYATDFTSTTLTSVTISASGTISFTFSATVTLVTGTFLAPTGSAGNTFNGLDDALDSSGTYNGIDRSDYRNRRWRATVLQNAGTLRPLSLNLLQSAMDAVSEAAGEDDLITHVLSHYATRREYISILQPDVRYMPERLQGGQRVLTFNGVDYHFEVDAPYNSVYGVNAPSLHCWKWSELEWADEDGSILSRVSDVDRWEAFMRWLGNFGTDFPNKHFRILDVQQTL